MSAKTTFYAFIPASCILLIVMWSWALAHRVAVGQSIVSAIVTISLCVVGAFLMKWPLDAFDRARSISSFSRAACLVAVGPMAIGAAVAVSERVPSKWGASSFLERRYSILFFAIAAFLVGLTVLANIRSNRDEA